jgi:hypothetical protein
VATISCVASQPIPLKRIFFFFFWDRVSLCNPGWPQTYHPPPPPKYWDYSCVIPHLAGRGLLESVLAPSRQPLCLFPLLICLVSFHCNKTKWRTLWVPWWLTKSAEGLGTSNTGCLVDYKEKYQHCQRKVNGYHCKIYLWNSFKYNFTHSFICSFVYMASTHFLPPLSHKGPRSVLASEASLLHDWALKLWH